MGDDLLKLLAAISLAKRTVNNMRQNITIAMITVTLLLVGVLFGGVTMAIGMLVHEASVLIVIINAMRLYADGPDSQRRGSPLPVRYMPSNILLDLIRTRKGLKWASPRCPGRSLPGHRLLVHHTHRKRRPRWLHLVVLVCL